MLKAPTAIAPAITPGVKRRYSRPLPLGSPPPNPVTIIVRQVFVCEILRDLMLRDE